MKNSKSLYIIQGALIASLYIVLTLVSAAFGMASGAVQIRLSEALAVLPYFTPAAVPGLTVGCLLANILTGGAPWDVVFGTAATLAGALVARRLREHRYFVSLPNAIFNTIVIPFVLIKVYGIEQAFWYLALTVGIGEIISCCILGTLLIKVLEPRAARLFPDYKTGGRMKK